jgi:glucose dehydrogenase
MNARRGASAARFGVGLAAVLFSASLVFPGTWQNETDPSSVDWPAYNGSLTGNHFSPLKQINKDNVNQLRVAWQFDTGETGGLQTNPLIINGILYAYTPSQKVIALDAATGKPVWKFDSGILGTQPDRGLAYWTDGQHTRIFAGVMNYLYALDAATGKPIVDFGEGGRIDLRKGLRGDYREQSIALTSPGVVYKDMIIVGGRNPETHPAPPGDIRAFDVRTGALRWTYHTIPHPGEFGYETWPPDAWKYSGAANNWAGMTLDPERGIVYVPTGSAVSDFVGTDRVGNDLFADTLLALDANTGKRLWHFQGVHHDLWDRDFPAPPALVTVTRDGKRIDAVAQTTKQGIVYLFDRATGAPLFPIEERQFPASDVPGEAASATQPFVDVPAPFARQTLTEELLTTRTPEAHAWAVAQFKTFRSEGQFVPFSLNRPTVVFPGFDGGAEWGGPAVDPATSVLYVNANDVAWTGALAERSAMESAGAKLYLNRCSACHGATRAGSPPEFPSLVDVTQRLSPATIEATIRNGRGRMPASQGLSEEQIQEILLYLKNGAIGDKGGKHEMPSPQGDAGAAVYQAKCAACHGDDMKGRPPHYPSVKEAAQLFSAEQASIQITRGTGRMPEFPEIQGEELASLLRYLGFSEPTEASAQRAASAAHPETLSTDGTDSADMKYRFTGYKKFLDPEGYPAVAPPWGTLNAIDMNTGKYLWKIPLGEYPELEAKGMAATGSENYGGPVITASGLLFIGATVFDSKIRAFDSATGKLLWEGTLPFPATATPATYMVKGKQYVVIACGGGKNPKAPSGGVYVAFALN